MPAIQWDLDWLAVRLLLEVYEINRRIYYDRNTSRLRALYQELTTEDRMADSAIISRLKEKLGKASGVAQRAVSAVEAEADALIAEEDAIKARTTDAFAPHKAILAEASTELQAVKDALNVMSNGGPPLFSGSDSTATVLPPVTLNAAGVVPETH
jgi:hypothetical protein